jgi:hypothetical protein
MFSRKVQSTALKLKFDLQPLIKIGQYILIRLIFSKNFEFSKFRKKTIFRHQIEKLHFIIMAQLY